MGRVVEAVELNFAGAHGGGHGVGHFVCAVLVVLVGVTGREQDGLLQVALELLHL